MEQDLQKLIALDIDEVFLCRRGDLFHPDNNSTKCAVLLNKTTLILLLNELR